MPDNQALNSREWNLNRIEELRREAAAYDEKGLTLLARDCRAEADALARSIKAGDQK